MTISEVSNGLGDILKEWMSPLHSDVAPKVSVHMDLSAGYDLLAEFFRFVNDNCGEKKAGVTLPIPLFITTVPSARHVRGLNIPSEFILDAFDLPRLADRVEQLRRIHEKGISWALLRSMCVGAFRKYLYLDDDNHGLGEMDPFVLGRLAPEKFRSAWVNKQGQFWAEVVLERIASMKSPEKGSPDKDAKAKAFHVLFEDSVQAIEQAMKDVQNAANKTPREIPPVPTNATP